MISRRQCLAAMTASGAATALGVLPPSRARTAPQAARRLITVLAFGGWDTCYALDPKPGSNTIDLPEGEVKEYHGLPIFTHPSRAAVGDFFAQYGDQCAIVNGIDTQSLVHDDCARRTLTGTRTPGAPSLGAIVAFELAADLPAPFLVLGSNTYAGPYAALTVRMGTSTQLKALIHNRPVFHPGEKDLGEFYAPDASEQQLIGDYLQSRAEHHGSRVNIDAAARQRYDNFISSIKRADALAAMSDQLDNDIKYSRELDSQIDLAIEALSMGLTQSVHIEQPAGGWDTHANNYQQGVLFPQLFSALSKLALALENTPGPAPGSRLADDTLVLVCSEMGRTPRLNAAGGKDHWPVTSTVLFGAGVRGGARIAATGDSLEALPIDLQTGMHDPAGHILSAGSFAAGVLQAMDIDPAPHLPNSPPLNWLAGA